MLDEAAGAVSGHPLEIFYVFKKTNYRCTQHLMGESNSRIPLKRRLKSLFHNLPAGGRREFHWYGVSVH
jgi:hypothetical protein